MTSRRAADTQRRLDEAVEALNLLERRLDDLEDLIEAAWEEAAAGIPRRADSAEIEKERDTGQQPLP